MPLSKSEEREVRYFKKWLADRGAEVLAPTNEWELVRFRSGGETSIVYADRRGLRTYTGAALQAWEYFKAGKSYRFSERVAAPRNKRKKLHATARTLIARDGPTCFYCGDPVFDLVGDPLPGRWAPSREHLVAAAHGGPDHLSNQFLACIACNEAADTLSAPEKIRMRDAARADRAAREQRWISGALQGSGASELLSAPAQGERDEPTRNEDAGPDIVAPTQDHEDRSPD